MYIASFKVELTLIK